MKIKHLLGTGLLVLAFLTGINAPRAQAQENQQQTASDLLTQISLLRERLANLQSQQVAVKQDLQAAVQISRTLTVGMSGDDVTELQKLLASDSAIYPEALVTGYYGPLTVSAVKRFQGRFGIDQVGVVGPVTRVTVNQLFKNRDKDTSDSDSVFKTISVTGKNLSDVDSSEFATGTVGVLVCHMPPGNKDAKHTIAVGGSAIQAHLNHGDTLGTCDNDSDIISPKIISVRISVASTSATIAWETDELSNSTVWYSTQSDFAINDSDTQKEMESENSFVMSHSVELEGLTAGTKYYFVISSKDKFGNETRSSESSFTTSS